MTLSEYQHIKDQIIFRIGTNTEERYKHILNELKELFRDDINSVRRFEHIDQIDKLLTVLELRDVLSETKIGPLKTIVERVPECADLVNKITEYNKSRHTTKLYGNSYASENTTPNTEPKRDESSISNNPMGGVMSDKKKARIMKTVTSQIGTYWRDLGRNLKLRESEIDDINDLNCSLPLKAAEILKAYDAVADPQRWFFVLCHALEKSRRKDLATSLQETMAMNI